MAVRKTVTWPNFTTLEHNRTAIFTQQWSIFNSHRQLCTARASCGYRVTELARPGCSTESTVDVVHRARIRGIVKNFGRRGEFDEFSGPVLGHQQKCAIVGHSRGLLHVVRDDNYRHSVLEFRHQFFDSLRRDGIE